MARLARAVLLLVFAQAACALRARPLGARPLGARPLGARPLGAPRSAPTMQSIDDANALRKLIKEKENAADTMLVPNAEVSSEINALREQLEVLEDQLSAAGVKRYSAVGRMREAAAAGQAGGGKDFFSELPQTSKNVALIGRVLLGGMALSVLVFLVTASSS